MCSGSGPLGHLGLTLDPCGSCYLCRVPGPGCLVVGRRWGRGCHIQSTLKTDPAQSPTYSTRWGSMRSAGTRSSRWPRECAPGTPASRACSSCRCPSRLCAARCQRSSASGCPHSRCCPRTKTPLTASHLSEQSERSPTKPPLPGKPDNPTARHGKEMQHADTYFSQGFIPRRE